VLGGRIGRDQPTRVTPKAPAPPTACRRCEHAAPVSLLAGRQPRQSTLGWSHVKILNSAMVGYRAALVIAALSVAAQRPSADGRAGGIVEDRAALLAFWRHADNARVRDGRRTIMNTYGSIVLGGWSDELNEDGGMVSEPCGAGSHDNPQTGWLGLMCDGIAELCFESCSQTATGRNCRGGCSDSCACDRSRFCCTTWTGACDSCQDGRGNAFGCGAGDCTSSPYGPGEGGRVVYVGLEGGRGISGDVATFASMGALQWLVLNANSGVYGDVASLSGLSELRMLNLRDTSVHGSVSRALRHPPRTPTDARTQSPTSHNILARG
jgi:hypothetical protein